MKILSLWPPHIPSYFNAGHHLPVFLNAAYLRVLAHDVTAVDAGALNMDWKRFGDLIYQGAYDLVSIVNDFDNTDDFDRTVRYIRRLSPGAAIVTSGRLSAQAPEVFRSSDVDGFVTNGDPEAAVGAFASWIEAGKPPADLPAGATVRINDTWLASQVSGAVLTPDEWVLPDVTEIPYDAYEALYERDQNKFCGIPFRRELVVPVARGCPIGCAYCDVPGVQGKRDRRLTVDRTIAYIKDSFANQSFEYVSFYAPTFTLDRKWVKQLCDALVAEGAPYPWKCATTIAHLPTELLEAMSRSGCIRVSVGLETLEPDGQGRLPRQKQITAERFKQLADACRSLGIELNCFVIAGLPGTTSEGVGRTVKMIRSVGGRTRPTMYADIGRLREAKTLDVAALYNRHLLHPSNTDQSDAELQRFVFGHEPYITKVMDKIPTRLLKVRER